MRIAPALLLCVSAGCIIHDFDRPSDVYRPTPRVVREYREHGPICPDIIAAASAHKESMRVGPLKALAARPALSTHEQVHLIDAACDAMSTDASRVAVLEVLAGNPDLMPDARMHLARRLREIGPLADRVTAALLKNPPKSAPPPPPPPPPDDGSCPELGVSVTTSGRVVVVSVAEGGPAAGAGLQPGDLIVGLNDWAVSDLASFRHGVKNEIEVKKAAEVWVKAERSGARIALNLALKR